MVLVRTLDLELLPALDLGLEPERTVVSWTASMPMLVRNLVQLWETASAKMQALEWALVVARTSDLELAPAWEASVPAWEAKPGRPVAPATAWARRAQPHRQAGLARAARQLDADCSAA